jgi:hypothetical protein
VKISDSLTMRTAIGLGLAFCLIFLPAPDASAAVQPAAPAATATTANTNSNDASTCQTSQSVQRCPSEDTPGTETLDDNHPNGLLPAIVFSILILSGAFWIIGRYLRDRHAVGKTTGYKRRLSPREEMTVRSFARSMKKRSDLVAVLMDEGYKSTSPRNRNIAPKQPEPDQEVLPKSEWKFDQIYDGYYPDEDEPM